MSLERFINNFKPTLTASIGTGNVALPVSTAAPYDAYFRVLIDSEIIGVVASGTTNLWSVERGIEGTTATLHSSGAVVRSIITASGLHYHRQNIIGDSTIGTDTVWSSNKASGVFWQPGSLLNSPFLMTGVATPDNPASGNYKLYFKSDNKLYKLLSDGTEQEVGSGAGGGPTQLAGLPTTGNGGGWLTISDLPQTGSEIVLEFRYFSGVKVNGAAYYTGGGYNNWSGSSSAQRRNGAYYGSDGWGWSGPAFGRLTFPLAPTTFIDDTHPYVRMIKFEGWGSNIIYTDWFLVRYDSATDLTSIQLYTASNGWRLNGFMR